VARAVFSAACYNGPNKEVSDMSVQTINKADRENIVSRVGNLPDKFMLRVKEYVEQIEEEMELEAIDAEIAALRAKYGTTPNAKTIEAFKEADAGKGLELTTLEEIKAECDALRQ
jgi:hypothetical protein